MSTRITRGLSYVEEIEVLKQDGTGDDLTGHTFRAQIRTPEGKIISDVSSGISLKPGSGNMILFSLSPDDTYELPSGQFIWDMLADHSGGTWFIVPTEEIAISTPATIPS